MPKVGWKTRGLVCFPRSLRCFIILCQLQTFFKGLFNQRQEKKKLEALVSVHGVPNVLSDSYTVINCFICITSNLPGYNKNQTVRKLF